MSHALKASVIDDAFLRLASSYTTGTSPHAGFPYKYFNLREYTSAASLFQIRASRYYSLESAIGRKYHKLIGSQVFGGVGLQLETQDEVVNTLFDEWAKRMEVTGVQDWTSYLYELLLHISRDGQAMVQPIVDSGDLYFSLLDVTRCARGYTDPKKRIFDGVEYNENWRATAYYFVPDDDINRYTYYGYSTYRNYQRIEADNVIRLMWREFTGQTHGLPWLNASARHMDLLDDFQRLVIQRAKNTTALNGYFERNPRDFDSLPDGGVTHLPTDSYLTVPQGSMFRTVNASFPETAYKVFTEGEARNVSMGGDTGYFSLTDDLQAANYSSIRHAKQAEDRVWGLITQRVINGMLDPMYQMWLDHYILMGPSRGARARLNRRPPAVWVGPATPFIDPGKEIAFLTGQLKNRTMAISQIIRSQGGNPRRVFEQIAEDIRVMDELGIPLPEFYQQVASAMEPDPTPEESNDDDDDENSVPGRVSG